MKKYLQKLDAFGLLLLVVAIVLNWVKNTWGTLNWVLLIAGAVFTIIGIAANYRQILTSLGKRSTKYTFNYIVSIVLVLGIVGALNYVGQKHIKRIDTTANKQYSLAPQTMQILGKLQKDVDIKAFYPGGEDSTVEEMLQKYRIASKHIRFSFVDPDRQPETAKQYDVTRYGTIQNPLTGAQFKFGTVVVSLEGRSEKIEKRSEELQEQDVTNAIIRAGRSQAKKVYFIQGHGEKDPADANRTGYSEAKKTLEDQGYKVEDLNLASQGKVPEDAKVLIEAGPTVELFPQELQLINDYLGKGGAGMLVMVDRPPAPSLQPLLDNWGIQVDDDVVLDNSNEGRLMGSTMPIVRKYESHKITDNFNLTTIFPLTRSVQAAKTIPSGVTVETLFKSNTNSWGEKDLKSREATNDPAKDLQGPLSLAVAATREIKQPSDNGQSPKSRLVVTGTSNFPINTFWGAGGNGNLFMNMISWLAQDEDLISIRPKAPEDRRVIMSQNQMIIVVLVTILLIPGIALAVGITVASKRRRK